MNAINVIKPYVYHGLWVFDDPQKDLYKEPFVAGSDDIMDVITADIPNAKRGFAAVFADFPFPGSNLRFDWVESLEKGDIYYWAQGDMVGWLCPALLKYFATPPKHLYMQTRMLRTPNHLRARRNRNEKQKAA